MRVLFLACARLLLSHAQVCFSRIARMRANGVGNAHAHYYSRDCGLLQSGTLLHHHVRLRGQRCQWVMWGNAWDTGEREISWRQDLWTRTSRRLFPLWQHWGISGRYLPPLLKISAGVLCHPCGCENWILTEPLCQKLESLQSELVNRMLKWPKHLSNTAALTTLEVPTVRS